MDPFSIAVTSFSLAGCIAKTGMAVGQFTVVVREAAEDLEAVSKELHGLADVLGPLSSTLSRVRRGSSSETVVEQIDTTLEGCKLVVEQIGEKIQKYQRDKAWTKAKWVAFGQDEMQKLRKSLEAYKLALSLGLQVISVNIGLDVKDDIEYIRERIDALQVDADDVRAQIASISHSGNTLGHNNLRVEQWLEDMAVLSSYAASTYQDTVVDPTDMHQPEGPRLASSPTDEAEALHVP